MKSKANRNIHMKPIYIIVRYVWQRHTCKKLLIAKRAHVGRGTVQYRQLNVRTLSAKKATKIAPAEIGEVGRGEKLKVETENDNRRGNLSKNKGGGQRTKLSEKTESGIERANLTMEK